MVRSWRIVKSKHAAGAFTGQGAQKFGARWNSPGRAAVYVAGSLSLAMLEMLVHLQAQELLRRYVLFEVGFDTNLMTTLDAAKLPSRWREAPPPVEVQQVGDDWLARGVSAVLRVPSAVVPAEFNYMLNPAHPDFSKIVIGPRQAVEFDPRLIKGRI
jgi:RES domain-containing protein